VRAGTGVHGSGSVSIYLAVLVMAFTAWTLRQAWSALFLAITMSVSAISVGAAVGFATAALVFHRTTLWPFCLKWGLAGAAFTVMFLWVTRREDNFSSPFQLAAEPPIGQEEWERMSPDEQKARWDEMEERLKRALVETKADIARWRRGMVYGFLVLSAGGILLLISEAMKHR